MKNLFIFFTLSFCLLSCLNQEKQQDQTDKKERLSIMTFNVENLFDTKDDPQKKDNTYLPKELKQSKKHKAGCQKIKRHGWRQQCLLWDWNEETLQIKMQRIAQVVQAANNKQGPDILVLQEVENINVLKRLNEEHLNGIFKHVLLKEGKDARGIDSAILSRLPLIGQPRLIPIRFSHPTKNGWKTDSRGILQAHFQWGNEKITILANHFPAPFHNRLARDDGFLMLQDFAMNDHLTIAAGDFNLTTPENKKYNTLNRLVLPHWKIAHLEACKDCKGTAYYSRTKTWSFLDMILVAKKGLKNSQLEIDLKSIEVFHPLSFQNKRGKPQRFSMPQRRGLSDHWPLVMSLKRK